MPEQSSFELTADDVCALINELDGADQHGPAMLRAFLEDLLADLEPEPADHPARPGLGVVADYGRIGR